MSLFSSDLINHFISYLIEKEKLYYFVFKSKLEQQFLSSNESLRGYFVTLLTP